MEGSSIHVGENSAYPPVRQQSELPDQHTHDASKSTLKHSVKIKIPSLNELIFLLYYYFQRSRIIFSPYCTSKLCS